jgi:hypothetical protein
MRLVRTVKERIVLRLPGMLRLHDVSRDGIQFRGAKDPKERDLSWLDYAQLRDFSADGAQIVFDDWGSAAGASGLASVRKADGSPATKLGEWAIPIISPDGTHVLAFEASAVGTSRPVLIPTGAGETRMLASTLQEQSNAMGFMLDQGALKIIQERMGHALTGSFTLDVYGHVLDSQGNVDAANKAGAVIEQAVDAEKLKNFVNVTAVGKSGGFCN